MDSGDQMSKYIANMSGSASHATVGRIRIFGSNVSFRALVRELLGVWQVWRDGRERIAFVAVRTIMTLIGIEVKWGVLWPFPPVAERDS